VKYYSCLCWDNTNTSQLGHRSSSFTEVLWTLLKAKSNQSCLLFSYNDIAVRVCLVDINPLEIQKFVSRWQITFDKGIHLLETSNFMVHSHMPNMSVRASTGLSVGIGKLL